MSADGSTPRIVVITGASSGIGFATAHELASAGARIVMVSRDRDRGERSRSALAAFATGPAPVLLLADLSAQAEVHRVAGEITERHQAIDVLINNVGAVFDHRMLSADGIEMTLATNHLAAFLLTHLLAPAVLAAPAGRIVNVASETYSRRLDLANLEGERRYGFLSAYRRSKLANLLFTAELARRLAGTGVTANAVSPGPARTRFGDGMRGRAGLFPKVMKRMPFFASPQRAARTVVYAASSPELEGRSGGFYMHEKPKRLRPVASDPELAARLWSVSESLCVIEPESSALAARPTSSTNNER